MKSWSCPQLRLLVSSEGHEVPISNLAWDSCYPEWGMRVPQFFQANPGIVLLLDHATYSFQILYCLPLVLSFVAWHIGVTINKSRSPLPWDSLLLPSLINRRRQAEKLSTVPCEIWRLHRGDAEDLSLLGFTLCRLVDNYRPVQGSCCLHREENKGLRSSETSVDIYHSSRHIILKDTNLLCVRNLCIVHIKYGAYLSGEQYSAK
jgi:hypothetical protein